MKTKEQIRAYNKEYFARPEVKERAKVRNAQYRERRKRYKKTEKGKEAERRYRRNVWDKNAPLREKQLLWRYGLTPDGYADLYNKQGGLCAICGLKPDSRLHIDHCHRTGRVRGLLCGACNRGLGMFHDDISSLEKAVLYLRSCL